MIQIPPFLEKGAKVALVSPAGCIEPACVERGLSVLKSWGLQVEVGANVLKNFGPFAGTDAERLADLQAALDNPEIRAVICTRGGYGSVRLIDRLDFTAFMQHPKWIVGFSDITVLLSHLQQNLGVASLHSCMPQTLKVVAKAVELMVFTFLTLQSQNGKQLILQLHQTSLGWFKVLTQ